MENGLFLKLVMDRFYGMFKLVECVVVSMLVVILLLLLKIVVGGFFSVNNLCVL